MSGPVGRRELPAGAGLELDVPDGEVGLGTGGPRVGRGRGRGQPGERAGDDGDGGGAARRRRWPRAVGVSSDQSIVKYGSTSLSAGRQVEPDLEQVQRVGPVVVDQREHLGVHDAAARGEPLGVAPAEAGGGAERVGVVDEALADEGDRLEARGGGAGGSRGRATPWYMFQPSTAGEVLADLAPVERRGGPELAVARGVVVEVVGAEQEGVDRGPLRAQRHLLEHGSSAAWSVVSRSWHPRYGGATTSVGPETGR